MTQLDYSLKTYQERLELVNKILEENPNPNRAYLTILGDYLALCMKLVFCAVWLKVLLQKLN